MYVLIIYLLLINALSFLLMLADKLKAKQNAWRIPEATLLTVSVIGGSFGAYLAMKFFRHKTRHPKFFFGLPLLLALHVALLCWLIAKL